MAAAPAGVPGPGPSPAAAAAAEIWLIFQRQMMPRAPTRAVNIPLGFEAIEDGAWEKRLLCRFPLWPFRTQRTQSQPGPRGAASSRALQGVASPFLLTSLLTSQRPPGELSPSRELQTWPRCGPFPAKRTPPAPHIKRSTRPLSAPRRWTHTPRHHRGAAGSPGGDLPPGSEAVGTRNPGHELGRCGGIPQAPPGRS